MASLARFADRLTTDTSAPIAAANLTARWPSPPRPATATRVPGPTPSARSGSHTVIPAHISGAAAAGSSPADRGWANRSRTTYSREKPPNVVVPSWRSVPL
ncbi:hypothetical protein GCM10022267_40090 [Lentzea roselyniae]|uniref:Uncharacterized protein n=1 Tax=Lentzea roselyniae TaxID=531940 RepID=A0ABP7B6F1_9PSEU